MAFAENKIDVLKKIKASKSFEDLEKLRLYYLGKKGLIPEALKGLGSLSIEEKKSKGQELNIIKKEIEDYIKKNDDFIKSEDTLLSVKIDQFAASSIDIRLICFTKTRQFQEWLNVKDTLALEIKNIVEKNKASFAFPSTSVYVEKNS